VKLDIHAIGYEKHPYARPWYRYRWGAHIRLGHGIVLQGKWARTKGQARRNLIAYWERKTA
jgi:hypothetical protein